ncbi:hypothetical protein EWM64_g2966 [Hericium alpestre]|uniref:Cytochrome P450 n=1 Tax=Hericium alpestre TaxID=135208 RepID=A0A4Z0A481_9AGAM|nr:hypothetical protein EWM64_g2966 [Hericium alpestre]
MTALLALVLHPEIQRRAQTEIDRVVGRSRLPAFGDRASLPYVGAIVRECLRWHHAAPLSATREVVEDDVYDGMFIPKGAHIFPNLWAITHDARIYADPHDFNPERFLMKDGTLNSDESKTTFGYGRRICIGQHLADANVWIIVANFLAIYEISKAKDVDGNEIPIDASFSSGFISHPAPFKCSIRPRDSEAETLIQSLRNSSA